MAEKMDAETAHCLKIYEKRTNKDRWRHRAAANIESTCTSGTFAHITAYQ